MEPFTFEVINRVILRITNDPLIPYPERLAAIRVLNALKTELELAYGLARKTSVEREHQNPPAR